MHTAFVATDVERDRKLMGALEDWLGRELAPTLAYEYPSVRELAEHLAR